MNEARLFTVRVWRRAGQFRAVVRAVGDEEAQLFTAPAPLVRFLVDATADGHAAEGAVSPDADILPAPG